MFFGSKLLVQRRRKIWRKSGNFQKWISQKLLSWFPSNLACQVVHMESIKYVCKFDRNQSSNYINTRHWKWWLSSSCNNTLVCCASFLATDTRPCVLIAIERYCNWTHTIINIRNAIWSVASGRNNRCLHAIHHLSIAIHILSMYQLLNW